MIDLYTANTPNGQKASIMLEEVGLPYQLFPIDIGKGDQHTESFQAINPNGKIPAIVDRDAPEKISYAINRYLDESIRSLTVLNQHLTDREFIASDYSIADIINYTWASGGLNFIRSTNAEKVENLTAIDRREKLVDDRPAIQKGLDILK